jgi:hypothetical protein
VRFQRLYVYDPHRCAGSQLNLGSRDEASDNSLKILFSGGLCVEWRAMMTARSKRKSDRSTSAVVPVCPSRTHQDPLAQTQVETGLQNAKSPR